MIQDYDGANVIDTAGHEIGTVERSYVDDRGAVRFVEVKIGRLLAKHRLVPVHDADETAGGLKVAYTKQVIEDSPDASSMEDTLTGDTLERVRSYYAGVSAGGTQLGDQQAAGLPIESVGTERREGIPDKPRERLQESGDKLGEILHRGDDDAAPAFGSKVGAAGVIDKRDVVEIPIVEERLVKQPVVTEVLRVHKTLKTERRTVEADVEVEGTGDAEIRDHS